MGGGVVVPGQFISPMKISDVFLYSDDFTTSKEYSVLSSLLLGRCKLDHQRRYSSVGRASD